MHVWKEYPKNRSVRRHNLGFTIITTRGMEEISIPRFCFLCKRAIRSRDDEVDAEESGCCNYCAMKWVHPNREAWKNGWRPTQEQVDKHDCERPPLVTVIYELVYCDIYREEPRWNLLI